MTSGESIGTEQFHGLTIIDGLRWGLAAIVVVAAGSAGLWITRDWTPTVAAPGVAEPVVLLDLAPLPVPEAAPVEPPPEVTPPPEPEPLPPEPVVTPPVVKPPEPVVEPEPVIEEPELPEPAVAMPVTMSADLRQQRLETPATVVRKPRVEPPAERAPAPQPAAPQPQPAVASGPSPAEWQAQVLRHLDRRKVYPREAQRAGQEGVVQIAFTINASGAILSVSVARSSGIPALDQAALDTARRASPVPRPPASVGQGNIALSAAIRFTIR